MLLALPLSPDTLAEETVSLEVSARTDQGIAVAGAKVTLRSTAGLLQNGETGAAGDVRFADLVSGSYQVSITATGFNELTIAVNLEPGAPQRIDAILAYGTTRKDSITVEGGVESPLQQSLSTPVALDSSEVKNMPDRPASVAEALTLAPAILRLPNGLLSISGNGEHRSTLLVNSGDATDPATGQFGAYYSHRQRANDERLDQPVPGRIRWFHIQCGFSGNAQWR